MPSPSVGQYNCAAMNSPTAMPTIPHTMVAIENCRTTLSL